ncbi:IclR family transcriptional regulator [Jeotgalibaca ciconiae]|uniref:IclR family transcriptional regulator n=1 Tax=Jeotgalibaca ciconiae TaxID=2496265 RepID=A0A3Q9BJQ4_9LACT|nr:IclR family transcriptional regulator [Jeotgalibaca ciconiae]AZP03932.1 IclR family transcriptional regulator [Jeotgalibaca ciconiae]HJB22757.1 IclR family transcriptional regulator [Candidatus Jeotgalibaca pullicola]
MSQQQPYGTVLLKAEKILSFLSVESEPQPLHIIASKTEMTNSTVSKILSTLELIGYVYRNPKNKTFQLGSGLVKYANQYLNDLTISKIAYPYLKELHARLDETVHLSIREGDEILYMNKLESTRPIVVTTSRIGFSKPMYASAMGKAILAECTAEELEGYFSRVEMRSFTPYTIVDPEVLKEELKEIRQNGYAFDNSEEQIEVFCIGTTLSVDSTNYGAFSVSMPSYRRTPELEKKVVQAILQTKRNIIQELEHVHYYL